MNARLWDKSRQERLKGVSKHATSTWTVYSWEFWSDSLFDMHGRKRIETKQGEGWDERLWTDGGWHLTVHPVGQFIQHTDNNHRLKTPAIEWPDSLFGNEIKHIVYRVHTENFSIDFRKFVVNIRIRIDFNDTFSMNGTSESELIEKLHRFMGTKLLTKSLKCVV